MARKQLTLLMLLIAMMVSAQPIDNDVKYGAEMLKPGTEAPDFKMKTVEGKSFRLSSLRGKYVVLDFWAAWCPDCRKDMPNMQRIYDQFSRKGVEFVGISFDTDKEKWQKAVDTYQINYTQVSELKKMRDTDIAQKYGIRWIPSMYLIGPDGKVVLATVLSDKLERVLYEQTAADFRPNKEDVTIDGAKGKLAATIQKPQLRQGERCPMVMICHGFTAHKERKLLTLLADSLQANGIASIRFDFNGHGESEGDFLEMTVPNEIEDARHVFEYVRDLPYVSGVSIMGHSQGGVVAAMLAGELGPDALQAVALYAPAAVLRDDAIRGTTPGVKPDPKNDPGNPPEYVEIWGGLKLGRDYVLSAQTLPIYETARAYRGPALIIHGNADRTVPYTYGMRFNEIWPGSEYVELEGFDHGFSQNVYRTTDIAVRFFVNTLKH
ncbi:MAG: alpha/beta fold hydrolase [Prevotella sp.]|nr:alpha/beta fold hydrolase [Prevotella sp.]